MITPDEIVLRAMMKIRTDDKLIPYFYWLKANLEESLIASIDLNDTPLIQNQGRSRELMETIKFIEESQQILENFQRNKETARQAGNGF